MASIVKKHVLKALISLGLGLGTGALLAKLAGSLIGHRPSFNFDHFLNFCWYAWGVITAIWLACGLGSVVISSKRFQSWYARRARGMKYVLFMLLSISGTLLLAKAGQAGLTQIGFTVSNIFACAAAFSFVGLFGQTNTEPEPEVTETEVPVEPVPSVRSYEDWHAAMRAWWKGVGVGVTGLILAIVLHVEGVFTWMFAAMHVQFLEVVFFITPAFLLLVHLLLLIGSITPLADWFTFLVIKDKRAAYTRYREAFCARYTSAPQRGQR